MAAAKEKTTTPIVEIPDPVADLVKAFNDRAEALKSSVDTSTGQFSTQMQELKSSFSRINTAVIAVLVLGFLALLFALIGTIVVSWQYSSNVVKESENANQTSQLQTEVTSLQQEVQQLQNSLPKQ